MALDLEGDGGVGAEELHALGQVWRPLDQKETVWSQERTNEMLADMRVGGDGRVSVDHFVAYFLRALGGEHAAGFKVTIEQFLQSARALQDQRRLTKNREDAIEMRRAYVQKQKEDKAAAKAARNERKKAAEQEQLRASSTSTPDSTPSTPTSLDALGRLGPYGDSAPSSGLTSAESTPTSSRRSSRSFSPGALLAGWPGTVALSCDPDAVESEPPF